MATQDNAGIPLTHAHNGLNYKLLELPPELLALLEADDAPVLTLESSANSALIKHGEKTWGLRQKNTSNALMLLSPGETTTDSSQIPEPGLKAIATVHDTIELIPQASTSIAPVTKGKWHEKFAKGR
ncbi:hypothetical protein TruAng_011111 [Truncatella angustata]|nr:hypothetical protein TruAng_011111 [Truncatella angustata]